MFDALRAIVRCIPYQGVVYRYAHVLAKAHAAATGHPDPWKYAYAHDGRHLAEAAEIFLTLTDPRTIVNGRRTDTAPTSRRYGVRCGKRFTVT